MSGGLSTGAFALGAGSLVTGLASTAYSMFQGSPKAPSVPAAPPAANPASLASSATGIAISNQRARMAGAVGSGFDGTTGTNPLGTAGGDTSKQTLG